MPTWNATNPVAVGNATRKDQWDRLWDNVLVLKTSISDDGDDWIGDVVAASGKKVGWSDGYFARTGANAVKFWNGTNLGALDAGAISSVTLSTTRASDGPVHVLNNGTRPCFTEYVRTGHTARAGVGLMGGPETNLAFNMDYSTNAHRFYDNTLNAYWLAMGTLGLTLQYAPAGAAEDIWMTAGIAVLNATPTQFGVSGDMGVLATKRVYLGSTRSNPQDAPSMGGVYLEQSASNVVNIYSGANTKISLGHVGLAATPSSWSTGKAIEAAPGGGIWGAGTDTYLMTNYYYNSGDKFAGTGYALYQGNVASDGSFRWYISSASGTAGNAATMGEKMRLYADGSLVVGAPTGGAKGAGTINAKAVYDDNVLLTDWVFDLAYDGRTQHRVPKGGRLFSQGYVEGYGKRYRRLPWMPTRTRFEQERSLGQMTTRLWFGQEQQQLYINDLSRRLAALEKRAA